MMQRGRLERAVKYSNKIDSAFSLVLSPPRACALS